MTFISQVPKALRALANQLDGSSVVRAIIITETEEGEVSIIVQGMHASLPHNIGILELAKIQLHRTLTGP